MATPVSRPSERTGSQPTETNVSRQRCLTALLRMWGLRPTRQRLDVLGALHGNGHRHLTADDLHSELRRSGSRVSLATVYNALRQFRDVGLVRELPVDGTRSFFDTNPIDHHHFLVEDDASLIDIPADAIRVGQLPVAPEGMTITKVDVLVRVRRIQ